MLIQTELVTLLLRIVDMMLYQSHLNILFWYLLNLLGLNSMKELNCKAEGFVTFYLFKSFKVTFKSQNEKDFKNYSM